MIESTQKNLHDEVNIEGEIPIIYLYITQKRCKNSLYNKTLLHDMLRSVQNL
jgi:hypothetical protein